MKVINFLLGLIFLLSMTACERSKQVDFDFPFEGEKLVVYALITNDSHPIIEVYRTQPVLQNNSNTTLTNVTASIFEKGKELAVFDFNENIGRALVDIKANKSYSISVAHKELEVYSDNITLPKFIELDSVPYRVSKDSARINFSLAFQEPKNEMNYYAYAFTKKLNGEIIEQQEANLGALLVDEAIKKITFEEKLKVPNIFLDLVQADEIIVKLYHVSPSIQKYYESVYNNRGGLGEQLSEQNPAWTNIQGGYGYFGGVSVDSVVIKL